ncbi:hypothetical protein NKH72_32125 [Mesorhizobium sp. M0955]|uniref:hypothetical protein n=1 Tax=unclassified Mesorhizobium TaxID=325217 RepID=UPI0033355CD8
MAQPGTSVEGLLIKAQAISTFERASARKFRFSLQAEHWVSQLAASVLQLAPHGRSSL